MLVIRKLISIFPVEKYIIKGNSMYPTFYPSDEVLVNKWSYLFKKPRISDIVLVKDPRDKRILIKRITRIEKEKFFVLGDNEKESTDSRDFGWIGRNNIIGRVLIKLK